MNFDKGLANKVYCEQLYGLIRVYFEWHPLEYHATANTFNTNWRFMVTPYNFPNQPELHFDYIEGDVTHRIKATTVHHDITNIYITFGKVFDNFAEGQVIVSSLITELYQHLHKWAVDNNTPPENMMY